MSGPSFTPLTAPRYGKRGGQAAKRAQTMLFYLDGPTVAPHTNESLAEHYGVSLRTLQNATSVLRRNGQGVSWETLNAKLKP